MAGCRLAGSSNPLRRTPMGCWPTAHSCVQWMPPESMRHSKEWRPNARCSSCVCSCTSQAFWCVCTALLTGGRPLAGRRQDAAAGLLDDHQQGEDVRRRLAFAFAPPQFEAVIGTQNMHVDQGKIVKAFKLGSSFAVLTSDSSPSSLLPRRTVPTLPKLGRLLSVLKLESMERTKEGIPEDCCSIAPTMQLCTWGGQSPPLSPCCAQGLLLDINADVLGLLRWRHVRGVPRTVLQHFMLLSVCICILGLASGLQTVSVHTALLRAPGNSSRRAATWLTFEWTR